MPPIPPRTPIRPILAPAAKAKPDEFRKALTRLATDAAYRKQATQDPTLITKDFKLSLRDLQALRQVAVLSGADLTTVNKVRAESFAHFSPEFTKLGQGGLAADVNVSCCSCCCCCCGETAVLTVTATCA